MKKIFGISTLVTLNSAMMYLLYGYIYTICSTRSTNFLHIPYEPSGMQLIYYITSLPFFMILSALSIAHCYYFNLSTSLFRASLVIWLFYFILFLYVDWVAHTALGAALLYYGSLLISLMAILYIIYLTYIQLIEFRSRLSTPP